MRPSPWLLLGVFCTTSSTLAIELLDTRLMSVVTWYHLSFLALSLAMLGMAAGAVYVYQLGDKLGPDEAPAALKRWSLAYAAATLGSHLVALCVPVLSTAGAANYALAFVVLTATLCVPFALSGVVVSIVLTRTPGPLGLLYAVDLAGAAAGCLATLGLLAVADLTTSVEVVAVVAAIGAWSFSRYAGQPTFDPVAVGIAAVLLAALQSTGYGRVHVAFAKGRPLGEAEVESEYWSLNGQVIAFRSTPGPPFYWSAGIGAPTGAVDRMEAIIDGLAATVLTRWDGTHASLDWTRFDLTVLPYHVVKGGNVAVIGVGGGRDVLSALWGDSRSVTGIELNPGFIALHRRLADYSGLLRDPRVTLVEDEARSWLTRTDRRFDVIQMSLIDTWAATGAGAFTLSENGLYTREAFVLLLDRLKDGGLLSVSRWYAPGALSETSRLVSLATSALIRSGADQPRRHLIMATHENLATLLIARDPLDERQLAAVREATGRYGFGLALTPEDAANPLIDAIASARSDGEIARAIEGVPLDLSPPTDDRPYFFNLVLPGRSPTPELLQGAGAITGNLIATRALTGAVGSSMAVLAALVALPLARGQRPRMSTATLALSVAYFGLIGAGFMLAQVSFLQRLGPFLGPPIYAVALVLFSMILATGIGSAASDRIDPLRWRWARWAPGLVAGASLVAAWLAIPPVMDATVTSALPVRALVAVGSVAAPSLLLGLHFPLGMRAVLRTSPDAAPWMWGVNGAAAVVASGSAVVVSMWFGIGATQLAGAACYLALAPIAVALWRRVA